MKKRNINKIILTSMTLFSFVGVTLPFVANSNSSINKIDNVRLGGTITLKAGAEEKLKLMYPFELNNTNFNEFFTIEGVPSDNVATYEFINQDNATGKILIRIRGNRIFNPSTGEATSIDWDTTLGSIDGPPAIFKIVPDMKISGGTELRSVGATNPIITNAYASDVYVSKPGTSPPSASSVEYTRVTTLINQMIKTIPGINKTSITINPDTDLLANNNLGTLTIRYKLTNYFSTNPTSTFIQGESGNIQLDLEGFKTVPGPTGLLVSGEVSNIIPENLKDLLTELNYETFFKFTNIVEGPGSVPLNLQKILVTDFDNKEGSVTITSTIAGSYFDNGYIQQLAAVDAPIEIVQTFTGFQKVAEAVDIVPIVIGGSVGGVALIGIVALTILIIKKSKKSNVEKARKQKMMEKSSVTGKGVVAGPSNTSKPGGIGVGSPQPGAPLGTQPRPMGAAPGATPPIGPRPMGPQNPTIKK